MEGSNNNNIKEDRHENKERIAGANYQQQPQQQAEGSSGGNLAEFEYSYTN